MLTREVALHDPPARQQDEAPLRPFVLDHLQPHAPSLRFFGRALPGVALVHVRQFHRLVRGLFDGPGQLALDVGLSKSTTQGTLRWLEASKLLYRTSRGDGPVPGALALRVPDTDDPGTFVPPPRRPPTVPTLSVSEALYRLRHGAGRIGKSPAVLEEVVECPGASRGELAAKLGKKSDSLSRPLKKLVDRGLLERGAKDRYWPAEDWEHALDRERTLTGEKLAESLDRAAYEREREAYWQHLAELAAEKRTGGE